MGQFNGTNDLRLHVHYSTEWRDSQMLDINVKITADERLVSALENLAAAISGGSNFISLTKPSVDKEEIVKETKQQQKAKTEKPKQVESTDNVTNESEKKVNAKVEEDKPVSSITLEDIRPVAKKLVDSGRQGDLKAIVSSFTDAEGNPAKSLPKVRKEDFAELFAKIQAAIEVE